MLAPLDGYIERHLMAQVGGALDHFRVVVLHGGRQCGKSTLARQVAETRGGTYLTLDDPVVLEAALTDPITFLSQPAPPVVVDEIQLAGDRLVRAAKQLVDADGTLGRFLFTGSTNFLTVPSISESLAGRARILRLWPLSQAELTGRRAATISPWFDGDPGRAPTDQPDRNDYLDALCRGGYPEAQALAPPYRDDWYRDYVDTVTQRDIVALADVRKTSALPRLLRWAAATTSGELNLATAARDLGIDRRTVTTYLEWLQAVFLVHELPGWARSPLARAVHRPKLHVIDSGLAASLLHVDPAALASATAPVTGRLVESFVVGEIARLIGASNERIELSHYRDRDDREVDLVLDRADGGTVAVEVKATASPSIDQLRHVAWLRDRLDRSSPGTFRAGILLHAGPQSLTVGDRLHVRPISSLWAD